jgi:hypothetical protein
LETGILPQASRPFLGSVWVQSDAVSLDQDLGIYMLRPTRPAPDGYPVSAPVLPFAEHAGQAPATGVERRDEYFAWVRRTPAQPHLACVFRELARLAAGDEPHLGVFEAACDFVDARVDCADFVLHGILRLLLQFGDDPRLPPWLVERAHSTVLGFKYGPEERGRDSMCTWTENHQILFAAAALVAGERFPGHRFANTGESGRDKAQTARSRVVRWLDLRFRTGMSEWLSNVYYDEDLTALLTLVDFAAEEEIRVRAAMIIDLLLLDMVLHSFRGVFGCTHGRAYEESKKWAANENVSDTARLLFGAGVYGAPQNMSAACFALSPKYGLPAVLRSVVLEVAESTAEVRQRMGIRVEEGARWGVGTESLDDGMVWLSMEAYTHPRTISLFVRMLDAWDWWRNDFFAPFRRARGFLRVVQRLGLLPHLARLVEWDITRNLRSEVNAYMYRTPDYALSSALDWRPGYGGDQQHLWQATLGPDAVCFTTHPGPRRARSPSHWTGSACLPRVAQVENVVIAIFHLHRRPAVYVANRCRMTHAWLPRDRFDEIVEQAGWIFARRGDGYLALRCNHPLRWQAEEGEDCGRELIAEGDDHVWICEMGRRAVDGPFEEFCARIAAAPLTFGRRSVVYDSPSPGEAGVRLARTVPATRAGSTDAELPALRITVGEHTFPGAASGGALR